MFDTLIIWSFSCFFLVVFTYILNRLDSNIVIALSDSELTTGGDIGIVGLQRLS